MTTAPYPQAKLADQEHSNLDSYTVKVGCPFFELAIGTSWHIFCFSIYAGSKDQPVAARESLSEPTHQTHSNSLFILPKATSLQIIAYLSVHTSCIFDYLSKQLMSTNSPVAMGQFQSPNGIAAVLTAAKYRAHISKATTSMIATSSAFHLWAPGCHERLVEPALCAACDGAGTVIASAKKASSGCPCGNITAIFGRRVAMSETRV